MLILTTPYQRAHRDTWNQVLVHPIRSPDDNVMPSRRSQDGLGWRWTSSDVDMCLVAPNLGQEPPHSPKNPREALSTPRDVGQWAKGIGWRPKVTKPPQTFQHANKHSLEQSSALVYGCLRPVWSNGYEVLSHGSMTWCWSSPYSTSPL